MQICYLNFGVKQMQNRNIYVPIKHNMAYILDILFFSHHKILTFISNYAIILADRGSPLPLHNPHPRVHSFLTIERTNHDQEDEKCAQSH